MGYVSLKVVKKNQEEKVYFFGAALYFKIRNIVKIIKPINIPKRIFKSPQDLRQPCKLGSFLPLAAPTTWLETWNKHGADIKLWLWQYVTNISRVLCICYAKYLRQRASRPEEDVNNQISFSFPVIILCLAFVLTGLSPTIHGCLLYLIN